MLDLVVITSFMVMTTGFSQAYKCRSSPKESVAIVELSTDFRFDKSENFFDSKLKVVYTWKIVDSDSREPIKRGYDGLAYKFTTHKSIWTIDTEFYDEFRDYGEKICARANGSVWLRNDDTPCQLPCKGSRSPPCTDSDVCTMLSVGYKTLQWNTTSLEFPVVFGRLFNLHVVPYNNWMIGHGDRASGFGVVKFCKDELIHYHNITHDQAHSYCDKLSMFNDKEVQDRHIYCGPVSHFEKYDVTVDFSKNRAKVSFRWKKPYDIHPNATLQKYVVALDLYSPIPQNLSKSEYAVFTIENVTIGETRLIDVLPVLHVKDGDNNTIIVHGAAAVDLFEVGDFDACSEDNGVGGRYCDVVANCTDLQADARVSALCACPDGFVGNGIADKWPEGTGCTGPRPRTYHAAIAGTCVIVLLIIAILTGIYVRSRRSVRRQILREEES